MARINLDEQFWRDIPKAAVVIGDVDKAIGQAVRLFDLAQRRYKHGRVITINEYEMEKFHEGLIGIFAEYVPGGIMAIGAEKQFGWIKDRMENGKKGGKLSAEKRMLKRLADLPEINNLDSSKIEANPSESNPPTPSLTLSLTPKEIIHDFNFESLFAEYPNKVGKGPGIERLRAQIKTQADFQNFYDAILNYKKFLNLEKNRDWLKPKQFDVFVGTGSKAKPWRDWISPDMSIFIADRTKSDWIAEAEFYMEAGRKYGFSQNESMAAYLGPEKLALLKKAGGLQQIGRMPANDFTKKYLADKLKAASQTKELKK